jgi:hypothetical protein
MVSKSRIFPGLVVVTDTMPHLETARRLGRRRRPATAAASMAFPICWNTWRSGDVARSARQIAEESRRSAAIMRQPRSRPLPITRPAGRRAARARRAVRHPCGSSFDPEELGRRNIERSAPPRTHLTISYGTGSRKRPIPVNRSAGRSSAPRRPCARSTAPGSPNTLRATIAPLTW